MFGWASRKKPSKSEPSKNMKYKTQSNLPAAYPFDGNISKCMVCLTLEIVKETKFKFMVAFPQCGHTKLSRITHNTHLSIQIKFSWKVMHYLRWGNQRIKVLQHNNWAVTTWVRLWRNEIIIINHIQCHYYGPALHCTGYKFVRPWLQLYQGKWVLLE